MRRLTSLGRLSIGRMKVSSPCKSISLTEAEEKNLDGIDFGPFLLLCDTEYMMEYRATNEWAFIMSSEQSKGFDLVDPTQTRCVRTRGKWELEADPELSHRDWQLNKRLQFPHSSEGYGDMHEAA
jgi:hypothetical protein